MENNRIKTLSSSIIMAAGFLIAFSHASLNAQIAVSDPQGLQNMQDELDGDYYLENDIDMTGFNFTPVGSSGSPFTGTFDGRGYEIRRLSVNGGGLSGLFGDIGEDGFVRGVRLVDAVISGAGMAGAVAGRNSGIIMESFAVAGVSGHDMTGGLVGYNDGEIIESYSMGSVSGADNTGGLSGFNSGTIADSYSRSSADGAVRTGGFVGYNAGSISNSYSTGRPSGDNDSTGGFAGFNTDRIANSFWDTQTSGKISSAGGEGKTTDEMKTIAVFSDAGWDFSSVWNRNSAYNNGYPFPRWRWSAPLEPDPSPEPGPVPEPEAPQPQPEPVPVSHPAADGDDYDILCFIATVAFGSHSEPEVEILRFFRNRFLLNNRPGIFMTGAYYFLSPGFAALAEKSSILRLAVRMHLAPAVMISRIFVN